MLAAALAVLLATTGPARPVDVPKPAPPEVEAPGRADPGARLERGYLRVEGHERAPLVEALVLRVPHLAFEPFEAAGSGDTRAAAFVDVRRESTAPDPETVVFSLTIVVSDGRAFDRRVQTRRDDEETTRLLASTAANLLLAIEAGTVEADRGDVPLPMVAPACPTCECPALPSCPTPRAPRRAAPATAASSPPRIELGPVLATSSVLGLGPPQEADRFTAAGAVLGVHARLRRGAFFGAEVRGAGRRSLGDVGLARLRVALGAGYRLRRGAWSLGASLWATVEPWWVRGGDIEPPPAPQWGLAVRSSPGLYVPGLARGRLALTVGPMIELSISGSLNSTNPGIGLVVIRDDDEELGVLRVGGAELSTGLSVTLWFRADKGD